MYIVKLGIFIGEYDKITIHVIQADNAQGAGLTALEDESHNDDAGYDDDGIWQDGDASYEVESVRKLTADEAQVLGGIL